MQQKDWGKRGEKIQLASEKAEVFSRGVQSEEGREWKQERAETLRHRTALKNLRASVVQADT